MIFQTANEFDKQRAITRFNKLLEKNAIIELTEKKPKRTIQQNRYLHLILAWFGYETGYTLEETKQEIFKKVVNPNIFYDGEVGEIIPIQRWRSTADLDTAELTTAIDNFRDYASREGGIYLPDPSDLTSINHMEIELKNNQII